jgi:hypothetical protein
MEDGIMDAGTAYLSLMRERNAYRDIALQMQMALDAIRALHPSDTEEGYNEWGEAECFHRAQRIAFDTLNQLNKEYGSGPLDSGQDVNRGAAGDSRSDSGLASGAFA